MDHGGLGPEAEDFHFAIELIGEGRNSGGNAGNDSTRAPCGLLRCRSKTRLRSLE
jgi:hypothetical protein